MPTSQPENQQEWPNHNVRIHDFCGLIYHRYNPSYAYLKSRDLHLGKAYKTLTDELETRGGSIDPKSVHYYDIEDNEVPRFRLTGYAIGTEMFYLQVQVTDESRTWSQGWVHAKNPLGSMKQFCALC